MARRGKRKLLPNGRNGEGQYWKLPYDMAQSDAWRSLSGAAVKVLVELRCRYNGGNNGQLTLSLDEAARLLNLGKATAKRALDELQAKGFITKTKDGHWYGRMATEWAVTDKALDGRPPSNTWRLWKPEKQNSVLQRTITKSDTVHVRTEDREYGPSQNPSGRKQPPNMVHSGTAPITTPCGADQTVVGETGRSGAPATHASPVAVGDVAATIVERARANNSPERCASTTDIESYIASTTSSAPPIDLRDRYSEWITRQPRGTEGKVGAEIGVSRPQLANFRGGRFGLSAGAAEKLSKLIQARAI